MDICCERSLLQLAVSELSSSTWCVQHNKWLKKESICLSLCDMSLIWLNRTYDLYELTEEYIIDWFLLVGIRALLWVTVLLGIRLFISYESFFLITADCACYRYEGMCGDFYYDRGSCDSLAAGICQGWSGVSEGKIERENHHKISLYNYISHHSVVINDETQVI